MRTTVVAACNSAEPLLTSRIPDLQFDGLPFQFNGTDFEVHANRRNVGLSVSVLGEPQQETRLAYTRVSDQEKLEEIIAAIKEKGEEAKNSKDACVRMKRIVSAKGSYTPKGIGSIIENALPKNIN